MFRTQILEKPLQQRRLISKGGAAQDCEKTASAAGRPGSHSSLEVSTLEKK